MKKNGEKGKKRATPPPSQKQIIMATTNILNEHKVTFGRAVFFQCKKIEPLPPHQKKKHPFPTSHLRLSRLPAATSALPELCKVLRRPGQDSYIVKSCKKSIKRFEKNIVESFFCRSYSVTLNFYSKCHSCI